MKNILLLTCIIMLSFSLVGQNYNLTIYEVGFYDTTNHETFSDHNWTSPVITQGTGTVNYTENTTYGYSTISVTSQNYWELEMEKEFTNNELNYGNIKVTIRLAQTFGDINNSDIKLYYIDDNGDILNTSNNSYQLTSSFPTEYTYTFNKQIGVSIKKLKIVLNGESTQVPYVSSYDLYGLKIEVDGTTNIQENIANNFNVYSYNKNLVVKTTTLENYSIHIYNISGQEVLVKNAQGNQDIPLNLATGVYIVNVSNSKESYNQKVVVQ